MTDAPARPSAPNLLDAASLLVILAMAVGAWLTWTAPAAGPISMHFDFRGHVDRWGDQREAALWIAALAALAALVAGVCSYVQRNAAYAAMVEHSRAAFTLGRVLGLVVPALVGSMMAGLVFGGTGPGHDIQLQLRLIMGGMALVMLLFGLFLGKTRPNPFVGVRTYWTLTSRLAWDKSNRLLGRLWFWVGLVGLLAAPLVPMPAGVIALAGVLVVTAMLAVIEGWRVWAADPDRKTD